MKNLCKTGYIPLVGKYALTPRQLEALVKIVDYALPSMYSDSEDYPFDKRTINSAGAAIEKIRSAGCCRGLF